MTDYVIKQPQHQRVGVHYEKEIRLETYPARGSFDLSALHPQFGLRDLGTFDLVTAIALRKALKKFIKASGAAGE